MKSVFLLGFLAALSAPVVAQTQSSAAPDSTLAPEAPIPWQPVRGANGKPLPPRTSGDFKVELRAGAWCRVAQFNSANYHADIPPDNFDLLSFAGFALQPRLFDKEGKVVENNYWEIQWSGEVTLTNGEKAGGSWQGDENGGIYLAGLNPYAKKGNIEISFADPKRPPEADGRFSSKFLCADLPYPTQINTFLPVNKVFKTEHGSQITLLGYGRYEPGLPESADGKLAKAGIYFFVKEEKPEGFKDADLSAGGLKVGAHNGDIHRVDKDDLQFINGIYGDLRKGKGYEYGSEYMTNIFAAPDTPRPLNLQLEYTESHPSWKQQQYFHKVSFPVDFSAFPLPVRDAKFVPVATAQNADVEVALDLWQDRSYDPVKRNYLAWFWTRDRKIADDPSLRWAVQGASARPGFFSSNSSIQAQLNDGGTPYKAGNFFNLSQAGGRFRPDGSPVLGSQYRPSLVFSADALQGQPQKWDMTVSFAQWRLKKHDWSWKAVPLPPAGQKVTLNRVMRSRYGTPVKLVNVAVYDAKHHFANIESELADGQDNSRGVAISFEVNLADFKGPKKFEGLDSMTQIKPDSGPDWGTHSKGDGDDISGQKSDAKVARWTLSYPLKQLEAHTFDLDLSWRADYLTGSTATFDFPNLPAPSKDQR